MHSIGLDFGSVCTKAVLLDPEGRVELSLCRKKDGGDLAAVEGFLVEVGRRHAGAAFAVGATGLDGVRTATAAAGGAVRAINEILATAAGVHALLPQAQSIIEIGGHTSKFVVLGAAADGGPILREFATNEACAAGTGSFLDQQARRLGLAVEELARLAAGAEREATMAGRCAVFAKSDMIHLQQKGTPPAEIALGLCMAIARNSLATLLKGRAAEPQVAIAGGCARNGGLVRAFRELLGAGGPERVVASPAPGLEGAIGAALEARRAGAPAVELGRVRAFLVRALAPAAAGAAPRGGPAAAPALAPLARPAPKPRLPEPENVFTAPMAGWLGVDVGSVSTDLVVLDADGGLVFSAYLPTRGRPVDVLLEGQALLHARFGGGLRVLGCGTTGSGRYLAARLLGADTITNEITAQTLGTRPYVPDVDSLFEIGGQDSKFISLRGGEVCDFVMNKICAAGTGSFLEEQAAELGVDIYRDFAPRAFAATAPCDLGSRCTVFMETEVVNALRGGAAVADICAGLAYSIVKNYLDKVVGSKPVGDAIVFQGGVASNDAVVAAFESVLGKPIRVHPYNRLSGAIGAALAARDAVAAGGAGRVSTFTGLDPAARPVLRSFECRQCSNTCEVNVVETRGEKAFFGDTCEKYTSRGRGPARWTELPNLADDYRGRCESFFAGDGASHRGRIGIPRASVLVGHLPLWATFFRELGFRPVLSDNSSQRTLSLGVRQLAVGACLPVKLTAGHVAALVEEGVDYVFLPSVLRLPGDAPAGSYACPYVQAVPFMIGAADRRRFLAPVLSLEEDAEAFAEGFAPWFGTLGASKSRIARAYRAGLEVQRGFEGALRAAGRGHLATAVRRFAVAILGKPYNTFDAYLNLGLFERLRRLGVLALPLAYLPLELGGIGSALPWRYSADAHRAAIALARRADLHPVLVTNFGCGPDAFAFKEIEAALGGRPYLTLEFDEHRGEAGMITRIEAFLEQLDGAARRAAARAGGVAATPAAVAVPAARASAHIPPPGVEIRIPYFADHAYAFSGLWRARGHATEILPLPGPEVRALGEKYSLGKECHAYAMLLGDLLWLAREGPGRERVYFFPGTSIPCLLHQYGRGMELLLARLGVSGLEVCAPSGKDLVEAFGVAGCERLYLGLLAIDLLAKAACEVRPYERARGAADALHLEHLRAIEAAVAGGDVLGALDAALARLVAVPVDRSVPRPVVGVTGDVYTKVNPVGNNDLYRWLEEAGLEVWPAPFETDLVDFGISRRFFQSVSRRAWPEVLTDGAVVLRREWDQWRVRRVVGERVARWEEPGYLAMRRLAAPYVWSEAHELLFLNVAKIVDYARRGADGVINAMCFNCMVGTASAAVVERIRRDHDDIPIVTAVYAGGEDPARRVVLEAFVEQVKAFHRRRGGAGSRST